MRNFCLSVLILLCSLLSGWQAHAHTLTFAVYSKYEATTSGKQLALIYALEKRATLQMIGEAVAHQTVDVDELQRYREFFSGYFFERFSVMNNGAACEHPPLLHEFRWDKKTSRVLAVTKFTCADELDDLTIRSTVTHDMPTSHGTMGDLAHGLALVRHRFIEDRLEAHEVLSRLPQTHKTYPKQVRASSRMSYVAVPDTKRRYEAVAQQLFSSDAAPSPTPLPQPPGPEDESMETPESASSVFLSFFGEGIWHILIGYDHILFILTLILTISTWKQLGIIVTSFTIAHSLTLVGATMGIVTIAPWVVEPVIALSVLFVAVDALLRPTASARPGVTFAFGLVHGFGLSGVLLDLGLEGGSLAAALIGFNAGVEIGQLIIVAPAFPLFLWLRKREGAYARTRQVICIVVALLAAYWFYERVF